MFASKTLKFRLLLMFIALYFVSCENDNSVEINSKTFNTIPTNNSYVPEDRLYTINHEWIIVGSDSIAIVGITEYGISNYGVITQTDTIFQGPRKRPKKVFGVEQGSSWREIQAPVDGNVFTFNSALQNNLLLINNNPYTSGWMYKMSAINYSQLDSLLTPSQYSAYIGQ